VTRARRIAGLALLAALAALSLCSARAHAGLYAVHSCMSSGDTRNASWYGVGNAPGTAPYAVCPAGEFHPYDTGLGARTTGGASSRTPGFSGSWAQFDAPWGTSLHSMWFTGALGGQTENGCWEAGIEAISADFSSEHLAWGLQPCHVTAGGWMPSQTISLGGAGHALVGIRCSSSSCQADWNGGHGVWANLRDVVMWVQDDLPPSVTPTHGALLAPGWRRGYADAWGAYSDNTGIRRIALQVDGATYQSLDFGDPGWAAYGLHCDDAYAVPCHNLGDGGLGVDTRGLSDGSHTLRLAGADSAGNWGVADRPLLVDNHAPEAPTAVAVVGGEGWRRGNGFDVAWANPGQGDASPISEARYRLCRAGTSRDCREGSEAANGIGSLHGIAVPDQGDWTLQLWLVDAAGHVDANHRSSPVHLRFDPQVDGAAFEAFDRGDPRRLAVLVTDHASGVAPGTIQLRRRGTEAWRSLPTGLARARLTALVPDTELDDGTYDLRALVHDLAGNERVADLYADGSAAVVVLPLRNATRILGRSRRASLGGSLAVPFGRTATIRGALQTYARRPVAGAAVVVSSEPRTGGGARRAATLRTGGDGAFAYRAPAGPSRTLRFAYAGNELLMPAGAAVTLRVPAAATLRPSRRTVRNGSTVTFSGALRARPAVAGKLVSLQAFYRRAWRTFAVARADARGRFRQTYRFQATVGRVAYRFRARIEREASYPFETGVTPVVTVVVRGG
jgi:hypothetical protein